MCIDEEAEKKYTLRKRNITKYRCFKQRIMIIERNKME